MLTINASINVVKATPVNSIASVVPTTNKPLEKQQQVNVGSEPQEPKDLEELDVAETIVYRPLFASRAALLNRGRRFGRSADVENDGFVTNTDDLETAEVIIFRPFFRARAAGRFRRPYYYYV